VKRALLLLVLALPATARADAFGTLFSGGDWEGAVGLLLLPYALSLDMTHAGFASYPYQLDKPGYEGPRSLALSTRLGSQKARGRWASHALARLRTDSGIGADVSAGRWLPGTLDAGKPTELYAVHATANYVQTPRFLLDAGFGLAVLDHPQRERPQGGFSDELVFEAFPIEPLVFHARYHGMLLHDYGYNDLAVSLGLTFNRLAVSAGYRAFFNPWLQQDGPEITFHAWF
jgi:hypothetical protein